MIDTKESTKEDRRTARRIGIPFIQTNKRRVLILDAIIEDLVAYQAKYNPEKETVYIFRFSKAEEKQKRETGAKFYNVLSKLFNFKGRSNRVLDTMDPYMFALFPHEHILTNLGVRDYAKIIHDLKRRFGCFGKNVREIYRNELNIGGRKVVIYDSIYQPTINPSESFDCTPESLDRIMKPTFEEEPNLTQKFDDIEKVGETKVIYDAGWNPFQNQDTILKDSKLIKAINNIFKEKEYQKN